MQDSYTQSPDGTWQRIGQPSPSLPRTSTTQTPGPAPQQPHLPVLHTVSLSDFLMRPLPQNPWLVQPLLAGAGVMGLAGDPGTAKTWLLLELARAVATGQPFLDRFPTQQGPALIIDEENGETRLQRRLARLTNQTTHDCPIHIASMCGVNLSDDSWISSLHKKVAEIKPGLILFDSLVRVHRGGENSAEDMATLFSVFTSLRHDFGSAIAFTHHLRKVGFIRDLGQRVRGSTDILAYVDSMLGITKLESAYTLWHLKNRDGDLAKPLSLSVEDTDEHTTVVRVIGEVDEETSKRQRARDLIMDAVADGDKLREELTAFTREASIGDRTFAAALKELETAKLIVGTFEGRKKKYSTPAPLQSSQPILYTVQDLQNSHPGNGELTPDEKQALVKHWLARGKPTITLGQSQWFNLRSIIYSTDTFLAQKRCDHTPELRQLLARWNDNRTEVRNESETTEVRPGQPAL